MTGGSLKCRRESVHAAGRIVSAMMIDAINMAQQACDEGGRRNEFVVAGEFNLMDVAELSSVETLRGLFEAFNEKRDLLHLLDHSLNANGVHIFIGEESGYNALDEYSVVTAPYGSDEQVFGVLGVIGPTRMAYERVIPIVDITARLLGAALNKQH